MPPPRDLVLLTCVSNIVHFTARYKLPAFISDFLQYVHHGTRVHIIAAIIQIVRGIPSPSPPARSPICPCGCPREAAQQTPPQNDPPAPGIRGPKGRKWEVKTTRQEALLELMQIYNKFFHCCRMVDCLQVCGITFPHEGIYKWVAVGFVWPRPIDSQVMELSRHGGFSWVRQQASGAASELKRFRYNIVDLRGAVICFIQMDTMATLASKNIPWQHTHYCYGTSLWDMVKRRLPNLQKHNEFCASDLALALRIQKPKIRKKKNKTWKIVA